MAPEIEVREAREEDGRVIHELACELADVVGDSRPEQNSVQKRLVELLKTSLAHNLVAEDAGDVVGLISFWIKPDLAHGDTVVEIPMLAVSKNSRRQGVGKILIEKAREAASEHGASLIELIATPDNTAAREFYRALGFVETDHVSLEFRGDVNDPPDK